MSTDMGGGPSRREFVALGVGAFVVAALPLAASRRDRVVRRTLPLMGTIAEVAVVDADVRRANLAIDGAMQALRGVERTMSRFSQTSDVGRANLTAARAPVRVGGETALVVTEALRWAASTDGAFDPAIGGAVALWDVTHRHEPPAAGAVQRIAGRGLYRAIEVGTHAGEAVLRYHDADARLDLGAIAKGYGVDRAAAALRDWGVRHALVNVGGDLYAIGTAPDGDGWRIGIQDPDDDRRTIATLSVADAAVATSGTYQQFFRWRGRRYHHLLDPATAAPRATGMQSLTIRAASCMHADAAATALFGMSRVEAARVLARCATDGAIMHSV
ncbi:MAG TPA: FAD:protein FMN transferase [Gemmatimonadaceae bacterium]|nr:FAD:protein FMN transferase [Gemmatimonadaceae bacterium]